jgi:hypothetical protein
VDVDDEIESVKLAVDKFITDSGSVTLVAPITLVTLQVLDVLNTDGYSLWNGTPVESLPSA